MVTGGEGWGGRIVRELAIDVYTLLYLTAVLTAVYSTGNSAQYSITT